MMRALIIAGGAPISSALLNRLIQMCDMVICADSGAELARKEGVNPQFIIGDLDSISDDTLEFYQENDDTAIIRVPEQETTDLEKAVNLALSNNAGEIIITAAGGSRTDHYLYTIGLLHKFRGRAKMMIIDDFDCIELRCESFELNCNIGDRNSLIPWNGKVFNVITEGLQYPLENEDLIPGERESISNRAVSVRISVVFDEGELLLIRESSSVLRNSGFRLWAIG
ncbi:thiamine diphosphokinase [bacterium]|nr:thiamine diphosphokinase [FCB group bacterium]MBL7190736.1 thiamine diphosphokinase [bacterium]